MSTPLVSIIMPIRNSARYLDDALQSVESQTFKDFELIIVDDGSSDNSSEIIRRHGFEVAACTRGEGAPRARNVGLNLARGEFIKFLDSDDMLMPRALEQQLAFGTTLNENSVGFGSILDFGLNSSDGFYLSETTMLSSPVQVFSKMLDGIQTSLPLHRRQLLTACGGFDERLKVGQEWNLHVRLSAAGLTFVPSSVQVCLYRIHDSPNRIGNCYRSDGPFSLERFKTVKATWQYLSDRFPSQELLAAYEEKLIFLFYVARRSKNSALLKTVVQELSKNDLPKSLDRFSDPVRLGIQLLGFETASRLFSTFAGILYREGGRAGSTLNLTNLVPGRKR